jgi:hypothetical protein
MIVATMEAVILQSMTSMRKPQREAMHTFGTTTTGIDAPGPSFARLNTEEGLGDRQGVPTAANSQMKLTLHNLIVIPQQ